MKVTSKTLKLLWILLVANFLTSLIVTFCQGYTLDPDGGSLNPYFFFSSYPWFPLMMELDIFIPYIDPLGYINVVIVPFVLNSLILVFLYLRLNKLKELNIGLNRTFLLCFAGMIVLLYIGGQISSQRYPEIYFVDMSFFTWPWFLFAILIDKVLPFPVEMSPILFTLIMNMIVLAALTVIWVYKSKRIENTKNNESNY